MKTMLPGSVSPTAARNAWPSGVDAPCRIGRDVGAVVGALHHAVEKVALDIEQIDVVVTARRRLVAETGVIAPMRPVVGGKALRLVEELALVLAERIVGDVEIDELAALVLDHLRPAHLHALEGRDGVARAGGDQRSSFAAAK